MRLIDSGGMWMNRIIVIKKVSMVMCPKHKEMQPVKVCSGCLNSVRIDSGSVVCSFERM